MPWLAIATIGGSLLTNASNNRARNRANQLQIEAQEKALAAIAAGQEKQAQAILQASGMAIEQMERFFQIARSYLEPYIQYGKNALPDLTEAFDSVKEMVSGDFDMQKLLDVPGYKFARDEAQGAVERSAAAQGNLLSGRTLNAVGDRVGQGVALPAFQDEFNRRNSLAALALSRVGLGANAAGALAGGALSTGQGIAGILTNRGNSLATVYDPSNEANTLLGTATNQGNLALGAAQNRASLFGNVIGGITQWQRDKQILDLLGGNQLYGPVGISTSRP